jgi:hypothetical protein
METTGLGGITLIVAAVVWLLIFVPGYAARSQLKEASKIVKADVRAQAKAQGLTVDEKIRRLINTQRGFSVMFALFTLGAVASAVAAISDGAWWFGFYPAALLGLFSLFVQRAAGKQAAALAVSKHRSKAASRSQANRQLNRVENREWTPSPLPQPLNQPKIGELSAPLAEVVSIEQRFSSSELDAILARRRAI